ncbi:alpha/beta hydrolase [Clostridium hydrogenum]|uniref:alpha/beta hydrolase n=1 Tax=Clostridium hydrogenum TaxID=2855764 RepID=UPI001EEADDD7|nr:alpha/beta hydrolase-fold protein [Clostridium hydrogenum]
MKNIDITAVPEQYKRATKKEQQGTLTEASYSMRNYINAYRQFVTNQNIDSKEVGRETVTGDAITKICNVYLPAGYNEADKNTKYNVMYLLHGVGGNRYEWLYGYGKVDDNFVICNILDNLIANGDIDPLIVIFPEGRSAHDWDDSSFNAVGTNLLGFYYFDYELRYDLIPFIEAHYNTYADIKGTSSEEIAYSRMHRAFAGLSMGGMQALNLGIGGYRCDSVEHTGEKDGFKNGLNVTVSALGMEDLFTYVGAFSNAPTSSDGKVLGSSLATRGYRINLLYLTCGDKDGVAGEMGYAKAIDGLKEAAGNNLENYCEVIIKDGVHDSHVWNNGAYNFIRLAFKNSEGRVKQYVVKSIINS